MATIGNFDGLHKGHQYLLNQLKKCSRHHQAKSCVITFTPHPREILTCDDVSFLINSYSEKERLIEKEDIDYLVSLKFSRDFSTIAPNSFVKEYLDSKHLRAIILGHDFSFGANKKGNYKLIQSYFAGKDIETAIQEGYLLQDEMVSSTKVRGYIREGNFSEVTDLLGRHFFTSGIVLKGLGRGKKIGFPTANIRMGGKRIYPRRGVYISQTVYGEKTYHSVTNVGLNPTFWGGSGTEY